MNPEKHQVTIEKPAYRPWGRYVCDSRCTEIHLFNTLRDAKRFASSWGRDCNVGWLSPVYDKGRNRKATTDEARRQISKTAKIVVDHRV